MDASFALDNSRRVFYRLGNSRLFSGVGANAYAQAVTLLIQFGSVPFLLSAWGPQGFGLWLVISAVPSYLALAEFGFSSAAANDMTLAAARGAHDEARGTFQSVLTLNGLVSFGLMAIVFVPVLLIPDQFLPQTPRIEGAEVRAVWILQTIQVAATLWCGAFRGGFQSSGHYALGSVLDSTARLLESLALVVAAFLFHRFASAAAVMLAVRLTALTAMAVILLRTAPWLSFGFQHAGFADLRRLAGPALAGTAGSAAFAVSVQGFVLVVGTVLTLDAVAVFATVRTVTRTVIQVGNIVNHAIMPEVTLAFGTGDHARTRRLTRLNIVSTIALNVVAFGVVAMFGSWIVAVWTRGRILPDPLLVISLAAVASLHCFWLSKASLILAVNRHAGFSYWFLAVSSASVVLAIPATEAFGLDGVLMPLLLSECAMILIVERTFHRIFGERKRGTKLR
jgi:O-antigen/teichoic acid export membrane protein